MNHENDDRVASAFESLKSHKQRYEGFGFTAGFDACRQSYRLEQVGRNKRLHYFIAAAYNYAMMAKENEQTLRLVFEDEYFNRFTNRLNVKRVLSLVICCLMNVELETPDYRSACRYAAALRDDFEVGSSSEEVAKKLDKVGIEALYTKRTRKFENTNSDVGGARNTENLNGDDNEHDDIEAKASDNTSTETSHAPAVDPRDPRTWPKSKIPLLGIYMSFEDLEKVLGNKDEISSGMIFYETHPQKGFKAVTAKVVTCDKA